ncbi:MAG: hypothetical protein HGB28_06060, partial [Oscillochloris sp.]|nr:hypothetical protein [Oscillochloris sp.]
GMALYERVVWRVRGQIRSLVRGRRITPADLPGMALARVTTIATLRGGPFQRHRTAPLPAPHARAALTARTATAYRQALLRVADPGDDHDSGGIHAHGAAEDHGADRTALKLSH